MCTLRYDPLYSEKSTSIQMAEKFWFYSSAKDNYPPSPILIHSSPFPSFIGGDICSALKLNRSGSLQMHDITNTAMFFFSTSIHNISKACTMEDKKALTCLKVELLDSRNAFEISLCD